MIMTLDRFDELLNSLPYPVAYNHFDDVQELPYICYLVDSEGPFNADNTVYYEQIFIDIELYVGKKNFSAESTKNEVKKLLKDNQIPWTFVEDYIESEKVFRFTFSITLI